MIKEFQIQLDNAEPISFEEFQQLEDTTFYVEDTLYIPNLKYKYYYSGREKKMGDIVLLAVLFSIVIDEDNKEEADLRLITIHPDEINNFKLSEIQPTVNDTGFPVVIYKTEDGEEEDKQGVDDILDKIINQGFKSLTKEEVEILNKRSQN